MIWWIEDDMMNGRYFDEWKMIWWRRHELTKKTKSVEKLLNTAKRCLPAKRIDPPRRRLSPIIKFTPRMSFLWGRMHTNRHMSRAAFDLIKPPHIEFRLNKNTSGPYPTTKRALHKIPAGQYRGLRSLEAIRARMFTWTSNSPARIIAARSGRIIVSLELSPITDPRPKNPIGFLPPGPSTSIPLLPPPLSSASSFLETSNLPASSASYNPSFFESQSLLVWSSRPVLH